jgi:acetyl-CoA carboxylase carboxyltransferase component
MLQKIDFQDFPFLKQLDPLLENSTVHYYDESGLKFDRRSADGTLTLLLEGEDQKIGIIYQDFKVKGGSFGKKVSERIVEFINYLSKENIPLIFCINSMGVRIMEGRTVFSGAFSLIPVIEKFKENNVLVTCNLGHSLGLGAVLFYLGHYRLSLKGEKGLISLAGPDVIKLFFGKGLDFIKVANSDRHFSQTGIVHDLCNSRYEMLAKAKVLAKFSAKSKKVFYLSNEQTSTKIISGIDEIDCPHERVTQIIESISEQNLELFGQLNGIVRIFLIQRNNRSLGVFINPPGNPNNMVSNDVLDKYSAGLDFFKALGIPIVSFLDTPGADPRSAVDSNIDIIQKLVNVSRQIIQFPHGKLTIATNRIYGGASVLGFPIIFGAEKVLAIKGTKIGIMDSRIISQLLKKSDRLLSEWKKVEKLQTEDLSDLLQDGALTGVIEWKDVTKELDIFMIKIYARRIRKTLQQVSLKNGPSLIAVRGVKSSVKTGLNKVSKKVIKKNELFIH